VLRKQGSGHSPQRWAFETVKSVELRRAIREHPKGIELGPQPLKLGPFRISLFVEVRSDVTVLAPVRASSVFDQDPLDCLDYLDLRPMPDARHDIEADVCSIAPYVEADLGLIASLREADVDARVVDISPARRIGPQYLS
jgi:hypothetical protein